MGRAKDIVVKPIKAADANAMVKQYHYSGKYVPNSQLHFGVFIDRFCEGAMQFGPPMVKRSTLPLVEGTSWNGMLELNRMAFGPKLPKNSESRALAVALKLIRKHYPHIEWILSFADGTQCGDGTIYRAAGFALTDVRVNKHLIKLPDGTITNHMTMGKSHHAMKNNGKASNPKGAVALPGFQLRYIYFLNPKAKERLTVPIIPYSKIKEMGASMYLGKPQCAQSKDSVATEFHSVDGGASPTCALQSKSEAANV
jgi:hypothetical protein